MGQRWVAIAANARSGLGSGRSRVARLIHALERRGLEARVAWTPESRAALVAEATPERNCRAIAVVGGDGTVAALINERPRVPITALASGTENLFARHFGLTNEPEQVATVLAEGRVVPLDLGLAGTLRFVLMAGFGFDAEVVSRHHLARVGKEGKTRPTNRAAYVEPVLRASLEYSFPPLSVRINDPPEGETLVGTTVFIFNLPRYALGLPIAPAAQGDDGFLDLVVFREPGPLQALRYLWLVVLGMHLEESTVEHRRVTRVTVSCDESVPVQLDGDPAGMVGPDSSWEVEALPHAINVLVPADYEPGVI